MMRQQRWNQDKPPGPIAKFDLGCANLFCFRCGHLVTVAKGNEAPDKCTRPGCDLPDRPSRRPTGVPAAELGSLGRTSDD